MAPRDLGRLLLEASRLLGADLVAELQERGFDDLRPGHATVALHIDRRVGSHLGDLAERARMTKQGMMFVVDELEERGYVRRVVDPEDSRAKIVRLTARGRRYAVEVRRSIAAVEARLRADLGEDRFDALREGLEGIVEGALPDGPAVGAGAEAIEE